MENNHERIEVAKVYQGILRDLILMVLTIGAGFGAVIFNKSLEHFTRNALLTVLGTALSIFSILAIAKYIKIRKILKEVEEQWKQ